MILISKLGADSITLSEARLWSVCVGERERGRGREREVRGGEGDREGRDGKIWGEHRGRGNGEEMIDMGRHREHRERWRVGTFPIFM